MKIDRDTPLDIKLAVEAAIGNLYDLDKDFGVELLRFSENYTFCITQEPSGFKSIVRVSLPGYHDEEEMMGELLWMAELSENTAVSLPHVFRGKDGKYIQKLTSVKSGKPYLCCMFSYLEGKTIKKLEGMALLRQTESLGSVMAQLHIQSQSRDMSKPIKRFRWELGDLFGERARWGDWHSYRKLTESQTDTLNKAEKIIFARVSAFGKSRDRFGLIHADLHCSNIIVNGDALKVFDFDDCGYGYYLYDFGCSLVDYSAGLGALTAALITGYEKVRKLTDAELSEIPTFVLLRRIVRFAWLESHSGSDTAKSVGPQYLEETCIMAEEYLESGGARIWR